MLRRVILGVVAILLLVTWGDAVPTGAAVAGSGGHDNDLNTWWEMVSKSYPRYENTTKLLENIKATFPDLVNVYTVGKSVQGREMWVINLRNNIKEERKLLEPPMKIVANMHGDETVGRSLVLMMAVDLLRKFEANDARYVRRKSKNLTDDKFEMVLMYFFLLTI